MPTGVKREDYNLEDCLSVAETMINSAAYAAKGEELDEKDTYYFCYFVFGVEF